MSAVDVVWSRLPLFCLFAGGYLVYRLVAVHGLTKHLAPRLFGGAHNSPFGPKGRPALGRTIWGLLLAPALLSFFLPNAVSVLALLPLAKSLRSADYPADSGKPPISHDPQASDPQPSGEATLAALCLIWGANIGGMGSLIGSPANLLLLAALDLFQMPQAHLITFGNWFAWSLPLVGIFLVAAWACARFVAAPLCGVRALVPPGMLPDTPLTGLQRRAFVLIAVFFMYWLLDSLAVALHLFPSSFVRAGAAAGFGTVFAVRCFLPGSNGGPLLQPADCISGLPVRGLLFLAVVLLLMAGVHFSGIANEMARTLQARAIVMPHFFLILTLSVSVMFLTEAFSNTVVATAFFAVALGMGASFPGGPLPLMMAVSCASTCAFMTPIATPANALAFGEMRGARLPVMLGAGFLLNILAALGISLWLPWAVPFVYGG